MGRGQHLFPHFESGGWLEEMYAVGVCPLIITQDDVLPGEHVDKCGTTSATNSDLYMI